MPNKTNPISYYKDIIKRTEKQKQQKPGYKIIVSHNSHLKAQQNTWAKQQQHVECFIFKTISNIILRNIKDIFTQVKVETK